jgi:hypothetical protein
MQWLRTIPRFSRILVALFLVVQFAGVVSSPLASAEAFATAVASHTHHEHLQHPARSEGSQRHGDEDNDHPDHCCALHAFLAGVLPPVIAVETVEAVGQRITANFVDIGVGLNPERLDRPPRPLL